MIRNEITHIA